MNDSFSLKEIAGWQLDQKNSSVELPTIQRGFVWKPKQVEDLWDSLLRGYPIGSFLFSRAGENLHLMDGQQRATSIFLGHFNPFNQLNEVKSWSIKGELPVVWIDVKPTIKPSRSKYLIRLTTMSHPWGYQANRNDLKLEVKDRRKSLEIFRNHPDNKKGYTSFKNSNVFPYDVSYPLPLCFFIESKNTNEVIEKAEKYLPKYISTKRGGFENKEAFLNLLSSDLKEELTELFNAVKNLEKITVKSNVIEKDVLNEETEFENPTLFVRINSSGTELTGDDLIYSIYKSIFPEAKNLIENIGMNFISPTQVLSMVSRIVASDFEESKYIKKMSVIDFQRRIKNYAFKKELKKLIETGEIERVFNHAIQVLSCENNSLFEGKIPPIIIKQFIKKKQDLFLFFVYWLHHHKTKPSEATQLKMVGKLLTFAWFDFSNVKRLWNEKITNPFFWEEPLNQLIWWNGKDGIQFLIKPQLLREYYSQIDVQKRFIENYEHRWGLLKDGVGGKIIQYFNDVKSREIEFEKANEYFWTFINSIRHNRQLILFVQREFINRTFEDYNQMDEIEDTNAPWDWDHIYPSEWVYNMKKCNRGIKDWNNTNGNFRAISLEHNRGRGNRQAPKDIVDSIEREDSFIRDDWQFWINIDDRIFGNTIHNHFQAITTRMISIYEKFWNDFKIHEFIREKE